MGLCSVVPDYPGPGVRAAGPPIRRVDARRELEIRTIAWAGSYEKITAGTGERP